MSRLRETSRLKINGVRDAKLSIVSQTSQRRRERRSRLPRDLLSRPYLVSVPKLPSALIINDAEATAVANTLRA